MYGEIKEVEEEEDEDEGVEAEYNDTLHTNVSHCLHQSKSLSTLM